MSTVSKLGKGKPHFCFNCTSGEEKDGFTFDEEHECWAKKMEYIPGYSIWICPICRTVDKDGVRPDAESEMVELKKQQEG